MIMLNWWLHSDSGLLARIGIGAGIFAMLAAVDLARHGRRATRWREYLFLLVACALAITYGVINDRIASSVSWEYFYFGKGLDQQLGPRVPPDPGALHWAACKVGIKATWSVGLLIGVALLLANNPKPARRQLPYRTLVSFLLMILLVSACFAAIGARLGSRGGLSWTSADLRALQRDDLFRPARFFAVYGMNLGGYVGGAIGTIVSIVWVRRLRRGIKAKSF
jgi:hypothetical protein